MNTQYDFPVELVPVTTSYKGLVVPKKLAVVRTDTDTPLGIVSDKYSFLSHKEVVDGFHTALEGQDFVERIRVERDGAQLYASFALKNMQAEVQKGDIIGMELLARNSYDGSTQLQLSLGATRLVCKNGMTLTKNFISFSHKHIGSDVRLDVFEVKEKILHLTTQFKEILPHMTEMTRTTLKLSAAEAFDKDHFKVPEYLADIAAKEYERAGDPSIWGMYNAGTYAITHHMRKEAPALQAHYGQVVWETALKELHRV